MKTIGTYTCWAIAILFLSEHSAVGMDRTKELRAQANQYLIDAAHSGNAAAISNALNRGAQPNCFGRPSTTQSTQTQVLHTPLCIAAKMGHLNIVQMLISAGAQVNLGTHNQSTTPLHAAAQTDRRDTQSLAAPQSDIMKLLIQNGASLYAHDALEKTPLEYVHGVTPNDMLTKQSIIDQYRSRQRRIYGAGMGYVICFGLLYSCSRLLYTWYTSQTDESPDKYSAEKQDQNTIHTNGDTHDI